MSSKGKKLKKTKKSLLIDQIRKVVCNENQTQIFGEEVHYENLEILFKNFLEESGYIVKNVSKIKYNIEEEKDLVEYFYILINKYKPGHIRENEKDTRARDVSLSKFMVRNRMEVLGCSKSTALQVCAEMIHNLIKFEQYYHLTYPITNFNVFNKNSIDWIFVRTEVIKNNPLTYCVDTSFEKDEREFNKQMIDEYGWENTGFELWEE